MPKQTKAQVTLNTQLANTQAAFATIERSATQHATIAAEQVTVLKANKTEYIHLFSAPPKLDKAGKEVTYSKPVLAKHKARYTAIVLGIVEAKYGNNSDEFKAMEMDTKARKEAEVTDLARAVTQGVGSSMTRLRREMAVAFGIQAPAKKPKGPDGNKSGDKPEVEVDKLKGTPAEIASQLANTLHSYLLKHADLSLDSGNGAKLDSLLAVAGDLAKTCK